MHEPPDTVVLLTLHLVADAGIGREANFVLTPANNESVHPGNNLVLGTGGGSVIFENVERADPVVETRGRSSSATPSRCRRWSGPTARSGRVRDRECACRSRSPTTTTTMTTTTTTTVPSTTAAPTTSPSTQPGPPYTPASPPRAQADPGRSLANTGFNGGLVWLALALVVSGGCYTTDRRLRRQRRRA